ncbi:MAG TPA: anion permease [Chlamydiales bacterium]|nr:anion permease [Chlamydiales bacterium]
MKKSVSLAIAAAIGLSIWFLPEPKGVSPQGWHLFALFVATMISIILKPLPMGVISIMALTVAVVTHTLSFADAFSGFSNDVVWLVVFAFFVARGFIATGLGNRMAYKVMSVLGKNSLGLGYGLVATDLILAPAIPSVTARVGGIVYPIVRALADVFTGESHDPKMGGYLAQTAFQGSAITSAMFLTAMAGNPLIAEIARGQGIEITWASWAIAAIVPGLLSLIVIPWVIFRIMPPTIRQTPHAKEMAEHRLRHMGPMKRDEWIMLSTFILLLILWIFGPWFGMKATVAAMIGLVILLGSGIMKWRDVIEEHAAWDTFIWFATLVTLSGFLNKFGLTTWFSHWIVGHVSGFEWIAGFIIVALIYFYSHYFFASNVAHLGAMYAPLLIVAVALGTPPELAALTLAFFSSLFGGLTHYGSGPAPILFGTGYLTVGQWWKMGLIASVVNIAIWMGIGGLWWKILGLW